MGTRLIKLAGVMTVLVIGLAPTSPAGAAPGEPGATTLVSVSSTGSTAVGSFGAPAAGGDRVAYSSTASTLANGDTNRVADIFLRDGYTLRIPDAPADQLNGASSQPALGASGNDVIGFSSSATNITDESDSNRVTDVFALVEENQSLHRVSESSSGQQANGASGDPSVSLGSIQFDPISVAFTSVATNLVAGDSNGVADVFVAEGFSGPTTRVSVASDGSQAQGGASTDPSISGDGLFVAFTSEASDLVPGDTNGVADIFVRDRANQTTSRVSVRSAGGQSTGASSNPSISSMGGTSGSLRPTTSSPARPATIPWTCTCMTAQGAQPSGSACPAPASRRTEPRPSRR